MLAITNTGYLNSLYPQSLSEFCTPVELPNSKGWLLKRLIPETTLFDGMGPYPIFACQNWAGLESDLEQIGKDLVSLSLVTDPFGEYTQQDLQRYFKDIARPYKEHFVIDLNKNPEDFISRHHRRNIRKAKQNLTVEICTNPIKFLDEWCELYDNLIERHSIQGITKFSRQSFAMQLRVPGILAFKAVVEGITVGMLLWYKQGDVGYYHLGAYSPLGYQTKASFALFNTLIEYFTDTGLKWLNLGAGAGQHNNAHDGLSRFKQGWSTGTRTAYFCGRIFDPEKYQQITVARNMPPTDFFPAYRLNER